MKNIFLKRIFLAVFIISSVILLTYCQKETKLEIPDLKTDFCKKENSFFFSPLPSDVLILSEESAKKVLETVNSKPAEYVHKDLSAREEVNSRLKFEASIKKHQNSVLN